MFLQPNPEIENSLYMWPKLTKHTKFFYTPLDVVLTLYDQAD